MCVCSLVIFFFVRRCLLYFTSTSVPSSCVWPRAFDFDIHHMWLPRRRWASASCAHNGRPFVLFDGGCAQETTTVYLHSYFPFNTHTHTTCWVDTERLVIRNSAELTVEKLRLYRKTRWETCWETGRKQIVPLNFFLVFTRHVNNTDVQRLNSVTIKIPTAIIARWRAPVYREWTKDEKNFLHNSQHRSISRKVSNTRFYYFP